METLLKKLYEKCQYSELAKLSKEELLQMITRDIESVDKGALMSVLEKMRKDEYEKVRTEYIKSISGKVEYLLELIELFKTKEDKKDEILKQLVDAVQQEKRMLVSFNLSMGLLHPIIYALDKKDLESSAQLMKTRIKIEQDSAKFGPQIFRSADAIDRMDLLDKFVDIIAEQCDEKTAEMYIQELGKGTYTSLLRAEGASFYYIGEGYIRKMYEEAKFKLAEQKEIRVF